MEKNLLNLMSFFFLPNIGTVERESDFSLVLQPHLVSKTNEGQKYDIKKVISDVEKLKENYLESLNENRPYGDLLGIADKFLDYCNVLISDKDSNTNISSVDDILVEKKINLQKSIPEIEDGLLQYLVDNFNSTSRNFNELTKFNHIYRFFNQNLEYNIEHRAYKNLIKERFGFDYINREIKGQTIKHLEQLEKLSFNYLNSYKKSFSETSE